MGEKENEALFKAAIQDNRVNALVQLFKEGFKPSQETLTAAFRNALQAGHDYIAIYLIHYNQLKNWGMQFNLDFMVAGKNPLAYAVSKKNPELVKRLLTCGIHFPLSLPKENKDEPVADGKDPEEELMNLAVKNLAKYSKESEDILRLLVAAGADISKANFIGYALRKLKDDHSELKDVLYPEEKNTVSNLRNFILEEFKQKNKDKYEEMCADLLGLGLLDYERNRELYQKIISLEEDNIDELFKNHPEQIEQQIKIFYESGVEYDRLDACGEWLQLLTDAGIPTLEIYNQVKHEIEEREKIIGPNAPKVNEPILTASDFSDFGIKHVMGKLDNLFISQKELNNGLQIVLGGYLKQLLKPAEILEYTALLLAAGAKLDINTLGFLTGNHDFISQHQISDSEHADVQFFRYLTNNKQFNLTKLMLERGLRFKDDYSFSLLEQLVKDANNNKDQSLLDILEPQYLREKKIRQAKVDYQKNKFDIADSKDSQNQIEALRTALFKAIGEPNFDKVIELVGRGANPNYGFHSMEEEYFVHSGGELNLKGLSPAHFACLFLKGNQAKEMFELLLDLGANMRIINEYSQTFAQGKFHKLFEKNNNQQLYHAIVRAELNAPSIQDDPTIAKDQKEQEHRAQLQKTSKVPSHLQFISTNTKEVHRPSNQEGNEIKKNRGLH